ncbi:hypothetical protein CS387_04620 [Porphyromonas gingivalis]|nr:hypothetical protein CS387_04620 [Porphyromonas gingivalis]
MLKKELPTNVPYDAARQTVPHIQARCFCPVGSIMTPKGMGFRSLLRPPKIIVLQAQKPKKVVRKLDVYIIDLEKTL